jgi:hypothetical protein
MAEVTGASPSIKRPLPPVITAIARGIEPLWIASTAALFIIWGYELIPAAIRALGHSGQTETIEWGVYMSMLVGFPVACIVIALVLTRFFSGQAAIVAKAFVIAAAFTLGIVYIANGRLALAAIAIVPAVITALMSPGAYKVMSERPLEGLVPLVVTGVVAFIAWMCAGGMVYWTRATSWFIGSPWRVVAILVATVIAITGLPRLGDAREVKPPPGVAFRIVTAFLILILIAFSFRTNPMVEFYHWGFWTGPIEQLRQGGWLLDDTPSQYGFLSILIPAALPGSAWISFWYYQAAIYAIVSVLMFIIFRRLRGGVGNLLLAFFVVFTTLFFRPRTAALLLPAQMTPSGGPVRFLWCFVMLGWLLLVFRDSKGRDEPGAGFPIVGHIIWICAIAWSFETAVYASAIWFSAFAVYLVQRRTTRGLVRHIATPIVMLSGLYAIVWIVYRMMLGISPDIGGYTEFALLYGRGGFGSLPIETHGAIWYLLLIFFIASTVVVQFLVEDWRDFRLAVAAGVWGGTWALASYFVSRSHPANLLSIAPSLLFGVAVLMILIRHSARRPWHLYVRAASVPVLAVPIAMTLGHPQLFADLATPQLAPHKFIQQVPAMDPPLQSLLLASGAKPTDSFVRMVDGRLVLPAWIDADSTKTLSDRSWLPKPYEIIGSLPPWRREVYLARNSRTGQGGWLIHSKNAPMLHFDERFAELEKHYAVKKKAESGEWMIWYMEPLAPDGERVQLSPR